ALTAEDGEFEEVAVEVAATEAEAPPLLRAESCEDIATPVKARLVRHMEAQLQQAQERALYAVNNSCPEGGEEEEEEEEEEEASEFSDTNVQVKGVDEADFVKNDAGYLYILADDQFKVIDAWPAADAREIASVPLKGTPRRMYVHADTAVIYSSLDPIDGAGGGECTYGYDCEFTGDGHELLITTLD